MSARHVHAAATSVEIKQLHKDGSYFVEIFVDGILMHQIYGLKSPVSVMTQNDHGVILTPKVKPTREYMRELNHKARFLPKRIKP